MKTIYKYPIEFVAEQSVWMPESKIIRHIAMQDGRLCLWAELLTTSEKVEVTIRMVGTGHPITMNNKGPFYIGTVQQPPFVWHFYEVSP